MHSSNSEHEDKPLSLVERLKQFNRKERYWLLRNAIGETGADLQLSKSFRESLYAKIGVTVPVSAWWAMDYHIDWLFSALVLDRLRPQLKEPLLNYENSENPEKPPRRLIQGTQEDFDLIIAFDRTLILIEAKGATNWGNAQMKRKCERLHDWANVSRKITPHSTYQPIDIFMVLTSPAESQRLERQTWPDIIKVEKGSPYFLPLSLGGAANSFLVTERCDEGGTRCSTGAYWTVESRPYSRGQHKGGQS